MRALAIDFGTVRIGLALSDELKMFASPLKVVANGEEAPAEIARLVDDNGVDVVVIGMPYRLDGTESDTTRAVKEFILRLRPLIATPIVEWDEAFSTRAASSRMIGAGVRKKKRQEKGTADLWAASVILQEYLDARPR